MYPATSNCGEAATFLRKSVDSHQILAAYRKEIKSKQLKPADETAYTKFYNFLLKCYSATLERNWNVLDTPEIMCLVLSKLP